MSKLYNVKQLLLDRIALIRIKQANASGNPLEIQEIKRKFAQLTMDEVSFTSIEPNPAVENGFVAAIDVSSRGYKLTNQRWVRGDFVNLVKAKATVVEEADAADVVRPGIYLIQDSDKVMIVVNEGAGVDEIFDLIGFSFDEDEHALSDDKATLHITSSIVEGDAALHTVDESQSGKDLALTADKESVFVGEGESINLVAAMADAKSDKGQGTVDFHIRSGTGELSMSSAEFDEDGKATAQITISQEGTIKVEAFFGLYLRSNVLALTGEKRPVTYTVSDISLQEGELPAGNNIVLGGVIKASDGSDVTGQSLLLDDGETQHSVTIEADGTFSVTFTLTKAGDYPLKVLQDGNVAGETSIVIYADETTAQFGDKGLQLSESSIVAGQSLLVNADVTDKYENPVVGKTVTFQGDFGEDVNDRTDEAGQAVATLTLTKAGEFSVAARTDYGQSEAKTFTVKPDVATAVAQKGGNKVSATEVQVGETVDVSVIAEDQYANPLAGETVTFKVGETSTDVVAEADGSAKATLTLDTEGTQTITVLLGDTTLASVEITVKPKEASDEEADLGEMGKDDGLQDA